jgi:hypothetical protein
MKKLLRALCAGLFVLPVLYFTSTWLSTGTASAADGWTNTGTIYQINVPPGEGATRSCFKDTRTPTPTATNPGLRDRDEGAMHDNWACKCLTDIDKATNGVNPPSWLIHADQGGTNPANFDYEAKLRENNAVQDYCRCRNTYTAGYCSCVYADKRPDTDCKEYRPPSYNYSKLQDPNKVAYTSIGECQATGHDFHYCNCRMNGGDNTRCLGILGSNSPYMTALAACQDNNSSVAAASLVLNYCTCVAAGGDDARCQESTGYGAAVSLNAGSGLKTPDKKASDLTEDEKKKLAAQGGQPSGTAAATGGTAGTTGTGAAKEPARLFGLPSIVPACARAASQEPPSLNCMMQVFGNIANLIIGVTGSIALLMFVWGGFLMITAAGAEDKIKKGKEVLKTALIGIAIIMLSGYVVNYAMGKLGVTAPVQGGACDVGSPKVIKMSSNGTGIVINVGGKDMCVATGTGCKALAANKYACVDYRQRAAGKTDCLTNLCPGDEFNICCPEVTAAK